MAERRQGAAERRQGAVPLVLPLLKWLGFFLLAIVMSAPVMILGVSKLTAPCVWHTVSVAVVCFAVKVEHPEERTRGGIYSYGLVTKSASAASSSRDRERRL